MSVSMDTVRNAIMIFIQRDLIRSLQRSRVEPQEEVPGGNGKQSRTGLTEKLNASRVHGIMGQKI